MNHRHRDHPDDRAPHRDHRGERWGHRDVHPVHRDAQGHPDGPQDVGASSRGWDGGHRDLPEPQDAGRRPAPQRRPERRDPCPTRRTGCCPGAGPGTGGPCRGCRRGCCPGAGPGPDGWPCHRPSAPRSTPLRRPRLGLLALPGPPARREPPGLPEPRVQRRPARRAWPRQPACSARSGAPCSPQRRQAWMRASQGSRPRLPSVPRAWPGRPHAACAQQGPRSLRPPTSHTHRSR